MCYFFRRIRILRLDGDDEFARVGKMLLIKFQALHHLQVRREKIEHLDIEVQSRNAHRDWHQQEKPRPISRAFHFCAGEK